MRETVYTLPDTKSFIDLWEVMNKITMLDPSFHPIPSEGVVLVKVDSDKVKEAKVRLGDETDH